MIDIIIPAYNAHRTLYKTLANVRLQTVKDFCNIYIVDDCSDKDYQEEVDFFSDELNITVLKTPHNMGPGATRQYGFDNSYGQFVIFLDSDDQFYNAYSVYELYYEIYTKELDMVFGMDKCEKGDIDDVNTDSLHGKIYRREFLEKNKIRFNNTKFSEDNRFNKLVMGLTKKYSKLNKCTHFYLNNFDSLTKSNSETNILLGYIENMYLCLDELIERNAKKSVISDVLAEAYLHVYWMIKTIDYRHVVDKQKVFSYKYNFEKFCSKYLDYDVLEPKFKYTFKEYTNTDRKEIVRLFTEFRKNFTTKKSYIDIIIPAHNVHHVISDALYSIMTQKISDCVRVYIANNGSAKNYQKEVKRFQKYLNIKELIVPKGCNPIQYGVDNSSSEYVTILEPTDLYNDCYSLYYLLNGLKTQKGAHLSSGKLNICMNGRFNIYDSNNTFIYGKLFLRSFLRKLNVKFDENYNLLNHYLFCETIPHCSWEYVYIGREDEFTTKNIRDIYSFSTKKEFIEYIKGQLYIMNQFEKSDSEYFISYYNKIPKEKFIAPMVYRYSIAIYYNYNLFDFNDVNEVFDLLGDFKKLYKKYIKKVSLSDQSNIILDTCNSLMNSFGPNSIINKPLNYNQFINKFLKYNNEESKDE